MRQTKWFLSSILGVAVAAAACSNESSSPSQPGISPDLLGGSVEISSCSPLPVSSSSRTIGILGGTIHVGPHTLTVPAGALTQNVTITATTGGESANVVRFQPEGLQFLVPASLTMSYENCGNWGQLKKMQIIYADDNYQVQEVLLTVVNSINKTLVSPLKHFSIYAVGDE